jgi:hypothetical protein
VAREPLGQPVQRVIVEDFIDQRGSICSTSIQPATIERVLCALLVPGVAKQH